MITPYVSIVFTLHIMAGLRVIMIMIMVVMLGVLMIRLLAALQRVLELEPQTSMINSYGSIVGGHRTSHTMVGLRVIMVTMVARVLGVLMPFAALQRVLEFQLPASVINSYHGVGIVGENRALLDGGSNIGRSGTHEGKNNNATKSSKLHERVS